MNPADAERKKLRQKEILRNKRERQFLRDASKKRSDPAAIRAELQVALAPVKPSRGLACRMGLVACRPVPSSAGVCLLDE